MKLTRVSRDVYLAPGPIAAIGAAEMAVLEEAVDASTHGRVRINLHPTSDDLLHEMLIAIRPGSYIRPHKHPGKSETFHLIKGAVDIVTFTDDGEIGTVVELAAGDPRKAFCYRMSEPIFHTLAIHSDLLVVHEITNGPFRREGTVYANFAPQDDDAEKVAAYWTELHRRLATRQAT